jgi:hypothetical protein
MILLEDVGRQVSFVGFLFFVLCLLCLLLPLVDNMWCCFVFYLVIDIWQTRVCR